MISRRHFIQSLGLAALLPAAGFKANYADEEKRGPRQIRLIQYGDPQIGFSRVPREDTIARLNKAVEIINDLKPDAVAILGDLMNKVSESPEPMVNALRKIEPTVIIAPGNHDIPSPVTPEKLEFFRSTYGPDRSSILVNGWKLIAINTQLWLKAEPSETEAQEKWLTEELDSAKKAGIPAIVLSHIPPYIGNPEEKDGRPVIPNQNGVRTRLLTQTSESGVRFWLTGHTHTLMTKAYNGMILLSGETTSRTLDGRPTGIRLLTAEPDGNYTWNFIPVQA